MKITRMTLLALSDAMQRGDLTSREGHAGVSRPQSIRWRARCRRIFSLNEEEALRQADECDKKRQQGEKVSAALRHSRRREGQHLRQGAAKPPAHPKMLADFVSPYSATVWEKIAGGRAASCSARRIWMNFAMGIVHRKQRVSPHT